MFKQILLSIVVSGLAVSASAFQNDYTNYENDYDYGYEADYEADYGYDDEFFAEANFSGQWTGTGRTSDGKSCIMTLDLAHQVGTSFTIKAGTIDCQGESRSIQNITGTIGPDGSITVLGFPVGSVRGSAIRISFQGKSLNIDLQPDGKTAKFSATDGARTIDGTLVRRQ